jgi:hypothetical protein
VPQTGQLEGGVCASVYHLFHNFWHEEKIKNSILHSPYAVVVPCTVVAERTAPMLPARPVPMVESFLFYCCSENHSTDKAETLRFVRDVLEKLFRKVYLTCFIRILQS